MSMQNFTSKSSNFRIASNGPALGSKKIFLMPISAAIAQSLPRNEVAALLEENARLIGDRIIPVEADNHGLLELPSSERAEMEALEREMVARELIRVAWVPGTALSSNLVLEDVLDLVAARYGRSGMALVVIKEEGDAVIGNVRALLANTGWQIQLHQSEFRSPGRISACLRILDLCVEYPERFSVSEDLKRMIKSALGNCIETAAYPSWDCPDNALAYGDFTKKYGCYLSLSEQLIDFSAAEGVQSAADVGCGTGVSTRALRGRLSGTATVTGYDGSLAMLRLAREESYPDICYRPIEEIFQFKHDFVFASASAWQIDLPVFKKIYRDVLTRGGVLAYNIPIEFAPMFSQLCNRQSFENMMGEEVKYFRTESFVLSVGHDELNAYYEIPIFKCRRNNLQTTRSRQEHLIEWILFKIMKQ